MRRKKKGEVSLIKMFHLERFVLRDKVTREYVETMARRGDVKKEVFGIWEKRIRLILILFLAVLVVWLSCLLEEPENTVLSEGNYVVRQSEDETLTLQVEGRNEQGKWEKNISVPLKKRQFSEEEMAELENKTKDYAEKKLPGKNPSLQQVSEPLVFVKKIPETEVELRWSYDENYIKESGGLLASHIPKEGADTEIMLEAECRNWKQTFYFSVHLVSPVLSSEKQSIQEVKKAMKQALLAQASEETVELPKKVKDTEVTYQNVKEEKSYIPVYLLLGILLFLPVIWREQQKKKEKEREEQMWMDHPEIVNKVMLLLGAGLTVRKAMERLATEYEREKQNSGLFRFAYEEICVLSQEMKDGVSEGRAMERFGKRCRLMPYLRFSSVISQNLKKGAKGILDILEKEALEAREQKKQMVLRMGETAGTKLLFPMLIMLGLVMGIIMVPAFMTM
ncbi:MAG: type II secretion system F family protein [Lachnospiraceae bacterium]|nr:type II secretion system F family protein [Lachnospiraceae bacterium]